MATGNSDSSLASSMTDLMTSLAVIFILLLVASLNNTQQEGEMTRKSILLKLREKLSSELKDYEQQGFEVRNDPKDPLGLIVVVPAGLLNFEVDRSSIPAPGIEFLRTVMPKIASTICDPEFRSDVNSIVVEGHTDSTGSDDRNLPLSQERSLAVVQDSLRVLSDHEANGAGVHSFKPCFVELLSATGRGSAELILDEQGQEDKNKSRRVIFKIRVRSLEQRIIKEIVGGNDGVSSRQP